MRLEPEPEPGSRAPGPPARRRSPGSTQRRGASTCGARSAARPRRRRRRRRRQDRRRGGRRARLAHGRPDHAQVPPGLLAVTGREGHHRGCREADDHEPGHSHRGASPTRAPLRRRSSRSAATRRPAGRRGPGLARSPVEQRSACALAGSRRDRGRDRAADGLPRRRGHRPGRGAAGGVARIRRDPRGHRPADGVQPGRRHGRERRWRTLDGVGRWLRRWRGGSRRQLRLWRGGAGPAAGGPGPGGERRHGRCGGRLRVRHGRGPGGSEAGFGPLGAGRTRFAKAGSVASRPLAGLRWRRSCHSAVSKRVVSAAQSGHRSRWR